MVCIKKLLEQVAAKITPSARQYSRELAFAEQLMQKIRAIEGKHVSAELAGSLARNTHLKGDNDIDLFVLFPKKLSREEFEKEGLRIGKKIFRGHKWEKAFSEHPYIRGTISGYDVEIVPSYKVEKASELQSAVDRSPFHNRYLLSKLDEKLRKEIRLLKQFLKGIGCYGAELKTGSVPGYVVELLVLEYGSFENTLKMVSKWSKQTAIDVENLLGEEKARKQFNHHLIVVDPTDASRNVAAALSFQQFSRFIAAARSFLGKPSKKFFFPPEENAWKVQKVKQMLSQKELVAVRMPYPSGALEDIVYGQLFRTGRKIGIQLAIHGFSVKRDEEWSDESNECAIVFELESMQLQEITKKTGPEVSDAENSERFLEAHPKPLAGPRIEQGRWVVEVKRKYPSTHKFLEEYVKRLGRSEKEPIRRALSKAKVLDEKGILAFYNSNKEFAKFLTRVLKGRERFLEW